METWPRGLWQRFAKPSQGSSLPCVRITPSPPAPSGTATAAIAATGLPCVVRRLGESSHFAE